MGYWLKVYKNYLGPITGSGIQYSDIWSASWTRSGVMLLYWSSQVVSTANPGAVQSWCFIKETRNSFGKIHTWLHLQISDHRSHLLKSCCGNYWELWPRSWETSLSWSEGQSYYRAVVIETVYVFGLAWLTAWGWGIWCLLINKTEPDYLPYMLFIATRLCGRNEG